MGITGTEVAKDAASMILTDDNFATIIKAVESGRNIYENIKKAIQFLLSGNFAAILVVIAALGFIASPLALWALPVIFLTGLAFAALGLIVTAIAPSYDFFMYYFTLFITPMVLVCGVFFPADQLPPLVQAIAAWLPLTHAVALVRPLLFGEMPTGIALHLAALLAVATAAFCLASVLIRRRLLK